MVKTVYDLQLWRRFFENAPTPWGTPLLTAAPSTFKATTFFESSSTPTWAEKYLDECMNEMDNKRIKDILPEKRADWIVWNKNPTMASHMGGVWESSIRTARTVLSSLIRAHKSRWGVTEFLVCWSWNHC